MQSNTREAIFGLIGILILGIVVWILIDQRGSADHQQIGDTPSTAQGAAPQPETTEVRVTKSPATVVPQDTPTPTTLPNFHVVQPGETLTLIAARYGLTSDALATKNALTDPNAIFAGQKLALPTSMEALPSPSRGIQPDRTYIVQEGDTLFLIAQEFGVSLEALAKENEIEDQSRLFIGSRLKIPEKKIPTPSS